MHVFYHTVTFRIVQVAVNVLNTDGVKYRHQLFIFKLGTIVLQDELGA